MESVRDWAIVHLPYDRGDSEVVELLKNSTIFHIISIIINWKSRFIRERPRVVHLSKWFKDHSTDDIQEDLDLIYKDISKGADLTKYLSDDVEIAIKPLSSDPKKRRKRADLDLLLNDWGIHHLHVSSQIRDDGFVIRSDQLLFGKFNNDDAYLICIDGHGRWANEEFIKILHEEFGGAAGTFTLSGITAPTNDFSAADRLALRELGVTTAVTIGGDLVMAGGGLTTAKTALSTTLYADDILSKLNSFERSWSFDPKRIRMLAQVNGFELPHHPNFVFGWDSFHGPIIHESNSRLVVSLDS